MRSERPNGHGDAAGLPRAEAESRPRAFHVRACSRRNAFALTRRAIRPHASALLRLLSRRAPTWHNIWHSIHVHAGIPYRLLFRPHLKFNPTLCSYEGRAVASEKVAACVDKLRCCTGRDPHLPMACGAEMRPGCSCYRDRAKSAGGGAVVRWHRGAVVHVGDDRPHACDCAAPAPHVRELHSNTFVIGGSGEYCDYTINCCCLCDYSFKARDPSTEQNAPRLAFPSFRWGPLVLQAGEGDALAIFYTTLYFILGRRG